MKNASNMGDKMKAPLVSMEEISENLVTISVVIGGIYLIGKYVKAR